LHDRRRVRPDAKAAGSDSFMISFQYWQLSSARSFAQKKADGSAVRFRKRRESERRQGEENRAWL